MGNLSVQIGADVAGFKKAIEEAKSTLKDYSKEAKQSSNEIRKSTSVTKEQIATYNKSVKALERVQSGTMNAEKAQKVLAKQIQSLKSQWNQLSDSAKNNEFGKAISNSCKASEEKLKKLKSEVKDVKKEINETGTVAKSSSSGFDMMGSSLSSVFSGLSKLGNSANSASAGFTGLAGAETTAAGGAGIMNAELMALGPEVALAAAAAAAAAAVVAKLGEALVSAAKSGIEFRNQLSQLTAQSVPAELVERLGRAAQDLGMQMGISSKKILEDMGVLGNLAPQLLKNDEALVQVTKSAEVLSQAALIPLEKAGEALITVLTQMQVSVEESDDVINALAAGAKEGTANIDYMTKAMAGCGKTAHAAGIDYHQLIALLQTIAPEFSDAGQAGNALNATLKALSTQTKANFNPAIVGLDVALANLAGAQLSEVQMNELVGASNLKMLKTLVQGRYKLMQFDSALRGTNSAYKQQDKNNNNLSQAIEKLKASWSNFLTVLGNSRPIVWVIEQLQRLCDWLSTCVNWVSKLIDKFNIFKSKGKEAARDVADEFAKAPESGRKRGGGSDKPYPGGGRTYINQTGGSLSSIGQDVSSEVIPAAKSSWWDLAKSGLAMATGIGSAAAAVSLAVGAIKDGINVSMEFNKSQSILQAVTGKSAKELEGLKNQALELGASTRYSASEIAGLQIELAKLGFDPGQIKDMTKHVQNFATATGADLSSAASMSGATLRMFGLNAKDAQRVADVLSSSCSKSALSFEYLNTAMSTIGPVANAFGLSIEDTTGLLGVLANAGFDASSAATAGRNIILKLADANGDLAKAIGGPVKNGYELMDALKALKDAGVDLAGALNLTDTQSVAAFNTLLSGADSGKELMAALHGCAGAAQEMSDIMSDNLEGDIASLNSAWEGLLLSLGGGQSVLRSIIKWLTSLVQAINTSAQHFISWATELYEQSIVVRGVLSALIAAFRNTFAAVEFVVKTAMNNVKGFFIVISKILEGDFSGAITAWKNMLGKNLENTKDFVSDVKKSMSDAWKATVATPSQTTSTPTKTSTPTNPAPTTTKYVPTINPVKPKAQNITTKNKVEVEYEEGSIGKIEQKISELQKRLKAATSDELRQSIQNQIDALTKEKEGIELSLKPKIPSGSLKDIENEIQKKKAELELAINDETRLKIQREIDELTGKKNIIELKLKPVIDDNRIRDLEKDLADHDIEVKAKVREEILRPKAPLIDTVPGTKSREIDKLDSNASTLKEELNFNQQLLRSYQDQYNQIKQKEKEGAIINANEQRLASIYEEAARSVNELGKAYDKTTKKADKLKASAQFKKALYSGITGTIDNLGNLNNAVVGVGNTWTNLAENWKDMSTFEKITSGISAVISTIQEVIGAYEAIIETINFFADVSSAASAKNIASNTAEAASDTAKTAIDTANTETRMANDTAENVSGISKIATSEGVAIAEATASGASLPFPANLAAIAAGIAAVVAAFAMISSFADGGIIGGSTHNGDYQLARVNAGEMILNGTQQKKLFNVLNSSGGYSTPGSSKDVKFRIAGQSLKGVLKNYDKKRSKI